MTSATNMPLLKLPLPDPNINPNSKKSSNINRVKENANQIHKNQSAVELFIPPTTDSSDTHSVNTPIPCATTTQSTKDRQQLDDINLYMNNVVHANRPSIVRADLGKYTDHRRLDASARRNRTRSNSPVTSPPKTKKRGKRGSMITSLTTVGQHPTSMNELKVLPKITTKESNVIGLNGIAGVGKTTTSPTLSSTSFVNWNQGTEVLTKVDALVIVERLNVQMKEIKQEFSETKQTLKDMQQMFVDTSQLLLSILAANSTSD